MSKVERGEIPVDRISVLVRVADALKVPLSDLLGEQNLPSEQAASADETAELRDVLSQASAPSEDALRSVARLAGELERVTRTRCQARYADAAAALARLIGGLEGAVRAHGGDEQLRAHGLLARAYGLAAAALVRYGEHDAAWIAADRATREAERAESPAEWTLAAYRLTHAFLGAGRLPEAMATADRAIDRASREYRGPGVRALTGALLLPVAIAAARAGDRGRAFEAMRDATALAGEPMSADLRLATQFGVTNVQLHEVSVAVELGDAGDALRFAERVSGDGVSISRYSRHFIDVAQAHSYRRDDSGMLVVLATAERLAPEQLGHSALVRDLLHQALRRERRRTNPELHRLAEHVGVL